MVKFTETTSLILDKFAKIPENAPRIHHSYQN